LRRVYDAVLVLLLAAGCLRCSGDRKAVPDPPVVPSRAPSTEPADFQASDKTEVSPEVASKVKAIIVEQLGVDESEVQLDTHLKDLNLDSLDCVELIMALEEGFGIEIPDEVAEKFTTVRSVAVWVEEAMPSPA